MKIEETMEAGDKRIEMSYDKLVEELKRGKAVEKIDKNRKI